MSKLTEIYLELYTGSSTYNELLLEEKMTEKTFSQLESFLRNNQDEIEKLKLVLDIGEMFSNEEFSISKIEELMAKKRLQRKKRRDRRIALIKWGVILLLLTALTIYKWWIPVILAVLFVGLIGQYENIRKKIASSIVSDWKAVIGK